MSSFASEEMEPVTDTGTDTGRRREKQGLSFRERRAAGVTFGNVLTKLREMQADGTLDDLDKSARAAEVLHRIVQDDPQAVKAAAGERDWESFLAAMLAFLEAIIPILMIFFGL